MATITRATGEMQSPRGKPGCTAIAQAVRLACALLALTVLTLVWVAPANAQQAPATPSSVSVTRGDGTLSASWPAVVGATSYHVTYSSDGGGSWSLAALNHPDNSIAIGVDNAKTYLVGVRARNEHGDSGWRNSPSAGPYTPEPQPSLTLSVNPSSVNERAGVTTVTVTATLASAVSSATRVTVSVGGGTATWGRDYVVVPDFTVTVPANATSGSGAFTLTPAPDPMVEGDETLEVSGSARGATVAGATITLTDGGAATAEDGARAEWYTGARLSVSPGEVSEDGGKRQVTVTAEMSVWGMPLGRDFSYQVTVGKSGDSAIAGTDYKAVSKFWINVKSGRQSGSNSFWLQPLGDTAWEGDETITIHGTGPDGVQSTTVTITDDNDQPYTGSQVTLSVNPSKVSEADGATTVTVTAAADPWSASRRVMVALGLSGSAVMGTDYQKVNNFDITLPANARSATGTFTLTPIQDTLAEGDETIGITGQVNGYDYGITGTTLTLIDDEPAPDVQLSVSPSGVSEDGGAKTVTVTATSPTTAVNARTVTVAVGHRTDDTATPGTDFALVPFFDITVPANAKTATGTFILTPVDDTLVEETESIRIIGVQKSAGAVLKVNGTAMTLTDDESLPAVTLSAAPSSVGEGAGPTSVTVTATAASAVAWARTVTVAVGGSGTATSGTDYAAVSNFDITIAANATTATGTFTLTPTDDATNEGNETVGISGQSPRTTVTGTTLTLADDDIHPVVTLSASPASVSEGAGATTVTVTATTAAARTSGFGIIATVGGSADSAVSGTDYSVNHSQFFINVAAGQTTGASTFTLTPTQDTAVEGGETISVAGTATGTTVTGTTVTIIDDDSHPAVTLTASPASVSEGASATSVTVTATAASSIASARTVTVSVGQTGTAASGTDYAAVADFTVTIAANATTGTGTFTLTPTQDTVVESDETIGVSGSSPSTTVTGTTLTLTDDDQYPAVTLSVKPASVGEEASATSVTVTATAASSVATARTVSVSVGDSGTATSGTDYTAVTDFTVTIAANKTTGTGTFTLTPTQDTAVEGNETIGVSGTSAYSTVTGTKVTLADDDRHPVVTLSVSPSSVKEDAGATTVTVTATPEAAVASARTVTVSVGASGDGAVEGTDYTTVADFTITIAANATTGTGTFTLTPTDDSTVEQAENITVSGTGTAMSVTGAKVTLVDNDVSYTMSVSPATVSEADGEQRHIITICSLAPPDNTGIYSWLQAKVYGGKSGDTATKNTDYTVSPASWKGLDLLGDQCGSATMDFTPTDDNLVEGDEKITIWAQSASSNYQPRIGETELTITDDDIHPAVTLSVSPASVSEGAGATTVTVTATTAAARTSGFGIIATVGGSADSAVSGTDYSVNHSQFFINVAAGQTTGTGTFTLTPTQDTAVEGNETIGVSGTSAYSTVTGTKVTLADDDRHPVVTLSVSPSSVKEDAGATSVTVTATAASAVTSARAVTVAVGGTGTATSGADYAAVSNFDVTIAANATSGTGTFTLTPTQDSAVEGNETIGVAGTSLGTTVTGTTVTLTDDDGHPEVTLSANPASVSEGASATSVTVTATAASAIASARTVTVSVGGSGTATSGTDYAAVSDFTITIAANATSGTGTFTLTPTQDTTMEGDETIGVSGTSTNSVVRGAALTLADDDKHPAVTLSSAPSRVGEGAPATQVTVTATAASAIASARTVTVSLGDTGTATSGTDYAAVSDFTITIAANATSGTGTFTLTPTRDAANEGDETIGVSGTSPHTTVTGTTLTLTDDDLPTITLETVPANLKVAEGAGSSPVTVRATTAAPVKAKTTVTLTVGASGDSATKTTDYAASNVGTITLLANGTRGEAFFDLAPVQDALVEGDETISVSGSSSGGHSVTGTSLTLTDDDKHDIALSASPASVGEGASATTVTVTATAKSALSSARTVTVSVGGSGTATSGTDYAAVSNFTITIAANVKTGTGTFTLTPTQDTAVEGNETIGVSGTSSLSTVAGTTVTLTDDDSYPAITLSANPASVSEGASATSVTVTATAVSAIASARTVTVSVGGSGTASRGTDYATVADFSITIAANATSGTGTFTLTPTQDTKVEGSETIGVSGASASSTVTGTTVALTDDDTHAITLSASPSTVAEDKASETITVTATINVARTSATTVTVSVGDSADEAKSGTDYKAVSDFTITIAANKTSGTGTFTFEPKTDTAYEGFESITISGTTAQSGGGGASAAVIGAAEAKAANASTGIPVTDTSLTLQDASDYPAVTLTAAPSSVSEGASATSVTVTATAASAIAASREVTVSVGNSGTATSGTDYTAVSDFIIKIAANKTSATGTFTLTPTQDTLVEGDETIGVSATSMSTTVTGTTVTLTDDDAAPAVGLTLNPSTLGEGASGTQVTVTGTFSNTNTYAADQTVTVSVGGSGTATSGTDYAAVSDFDLTIDKGETSGTATFTLTPTQDTLVEGSETIGVAGTVTGLTVNGADLTLTDDDATPSVSLSASPATVGEGAGATTVTVTAAFSNNNTFAADKTVTVSVGSGTATSGTDFPAVTDFDLTIDKGQGRGTATFTLTPTDDTVIEGDETIALTGASTGLSVTGNNVTIQDNDDPTINIDIQIVETDLSVSPARVDEAVGSKTMQVTAATGGATFPADRTVTIAVGKSGDGATSGTDYKAVDDFDLTLSAGKTSAKVTFTLEPVDDTLVEGDETLSIDGTSTHTDITVTGTTATIIDDDSAPAVNLSLNPSSVSEGASGTSVTVTAAFSNSSTYTVDKTVTVSVGGSGTATSGTDYTAVSNFDVTIDKGKTSGTGTFTLTPIQDTAVEGNETIGVAGSVTGLTVNGTDLTLTDDDSATVTVNDDSADEGESMTFTVTLDKAVQGGLTVTPSYTNGTAASGDYTENTTALSFTGTANETQTFTVSTTEDAVLEGNETFTVGLTVSNAPSGVTSTDTGTGTINNEDSAAVTIDDASADEGDSMTFTVTLDAAVQGGLTVTPGFTDGTATEGTDYDENTTALSFTGTANETQTFTVSTTEDEALEGNETFTVGLSVSGTSLSVTATATGTGTINNDDGTVVTVNNANADEGDGITFTVTLGAAVQGGLTVTPSFTDVTAVEGTDYDENTTALSFTGTKGETQTFTVSTTEDAVFEANETFTVGLSTSNSGVTATDTGTGTITNDDGAAVTINDASADEGDSMTFTVTLDAAVQGGLTVTPSFTDGTATEGTDYDENTTALTFSGTANETQTFTVSTTEDAVLEGNETFTVGLSVSGTSLSVTATDTGTGTINDDDSGAAAVTVDDADADEGESMTFTVTLTEAVQGGLTVTPGFTNGTASSTDYTANTTPLNFSGTANETKTFTVSTIEDAVVEGNETFTVGLSVSGTSLSVTATDTGTGTINNDDVAAVPAAVTINDASADEGDSLTFTVTLDAAVQGGLTVTPRFTDGTADGTDYTKNTTPLTFTGTVNETRTFTVATTEDTDVEGNETFTVGLSVSGTSHNVIATDTGTGTITNDDDSVAALTLTSASTEEGDSLTFTVTLDQAVPGGFTVTPSYTDGTADGSDYTPNTAPLSFTGAANEQHRFTVATIEDANVEPDETFTVGLAVTRGGGSGVSAATAATGAAPCLACRSVSTGTGPGTTAPAPIDITTDTATGTITNDDMYKIVVTATINLSADPNSLSEDADPVTVELTARTETSIASARTVTVTVGDTHDSATEGTDYAPVGEFAVTIAADATTGTGTFTLAPQQDDLVEGDETITVSGRGPMMEVQNATITLKDGDTAPTVTLAVTPSRVSEGAPGTEVTVTATFANGSTYATATPVRVTVGDAHDSATAGTDYAPVGEVAVPIVAGATTGTGTFTLAPKPDDLVEGDEILTVTGTAPGLTVIGTSLTLEDATRAPTVPVRDTQTPVLADLSLAMTDSVVRAVTARLAQAAAQRCARDVTVPGAPAQLTDADGPRSTGPLPDTTPSLRDVLAGSSFVFSLFGDEPASGPDPAAEAAAPGCGDDQRPLTVWGQGDLRALSGQQRGGDAVGWNGNVAGGLLGADVPFGAQGLAGLGVSHFQSAFDYQYTNAAGETRPGTYQTTMTSVHPYAKWAPGTGQSVWLTGGYGRGEVTLEEAEVGPQSADSWWATLAAGGLFRLSPDVALLPGGRTTVDLKTEAWLTRFRVQDNAAFLEDLGVHTHRLRLAVVGEHTWELASGGVLTPLLEFGVRRDGGDGVTGLGVEIGGRIGYVDPSGRFTVEGRGHVLTAHEGGKDEWGAGGVIRLAPQADGQGLWFTVVPAYGAEAGGAERLWEQGVTQPAGAAGPARGRVEAELGYGVLAPGGQGVVTPYGGLALAGAGQTRYVVGTRVGLRSGLACSLEGAHRTSGTGTPADYGVLVSLEFSW